MPVTDDDWFPFVWSTPTDQSYGIALQTPDNGPLYATVQRVSDGKIWPVSGQFETIEADHWTTYKIALTLVTPSMYSYTIYWSFIGPGDFLVRIYKQTGDAPAISDRQINQEFVSIDSKQVPRTDGVHMGSNFGGPDALCVTDPHDHGIERVEVLALKVINGTNWVRGRATTDRFGRWDMNSPLQPLTQHTLTFTRNGFTFNPVIITTPAAPTP